MNKLTPDIAEKAVAREAEIKAEELKIMQGLQFELRATLNGQPVDVVLSKFDLADVDDLDKAHETATVFAGELAKVACGVALGYLSPEGKYTGKQRPIAQAMAEVRGSSS